MELSYLSRLSLWCRLRLLSLRESLWWWWWWWWCLDEDDWCLLWSSLPLLRSLPLSLLRWLFSLLLSSDRPFSFILSLSLCLSFSPPFISLFDLSLASLSFSLESLVVVTFLSFLSVASLFPLSLLSLPSLLWPLLLRDDTLCDWEWRRSLERWSLWKSQKRITICHWSSLDVWRSLMGAANCDPPFTLS